MQDSLYWVCRLSVGWDDAARIFAQLETAHDKIIFRLLIMLINTILRANYKDIS